MTLQTMNAIPSRFNHVLAFEVSKAELHVHVLPGGESSQISNDAASVRRVIKKESRRNAKLGIGPLLVVCEATGSYDAHVLESAALLDVACHRAHGSRVRAFARFRGALAKSASGALEHVPVVLVGNLATTITELGGLGYRLIGLDGDGPGLFTAAGSVCRSRHGSQRSGPADCRSASNPRSSSSLGVSCRNTCGSSAHSGYRVGISRFHSRGNGLMDGH